MTFDEQQTLLWLTAQITQQRASGEDVADDWRAVQQLQVSLDVPAEQAGAREVLATLAHKYRDTPND